MLDTLHITGLRNEFRTGVDWVKDDFLHHLSGQSGSYFEISIRALGGLLGAYSLSGEKVLLDKAVHLGGILAKRAYPRPGQLLPLRAVSILEEDTDMVPAVPLVQTSLADAASEGLEFRFMAQHAARPDLAVNSDQAIQSIVDASRRHNRGLVNSCVSFYPDTASPVRNVKGRGRSVTEKKTQAVASGNSLPPRLGPFGRELPRGGGRGSRGVWGEWEERGEMGEKGEWGEWMEGGGGVEGVVGAVINN